MRIIFFLLCCAGLLTLACSTSEKGSETMNFANDITFLQQHTDVIVLADASGNRKVAVCPAYQGRVMTSTANGDKGLSYGWINRELIASGENNPHINAFGGEDRFWLGPEGGQFSIFFTPGDPFDLEHWYTPPVINEESWSVDASTKESVSFAENIQLTNYSDTAFNLRVDRTVRLLPQGSIPELGQRLDWVAFESENHITNTGRQAWKKDTGLLSIWILGMFQPSTGTTIVIPYQPGPESDLGPVVNDAYFGQVPADRLKTGESTLFFSGDGRYRSKIGISPQRAKPILGSYDSVNGVLTIVRFTLPENERDYVNSMWELQDEPYAGDAVNSYNDGPPAPGAKPLGPFYELETSSPAAKLEPGQSMQHVHQTMHFQGTPEQLAPLAQELLGVSLDTITSALP